MDNGQQTKRAYVHTWGCQMNEHKSEGIAGVLAAEGYELTERMDQADLVVFNTCMVREKAVDKMLSQAGLVRQLKERKPHLLLGIGGCAAQALKEQLFLRTRYAADFIFGSSQIAEVPRLIRQAQRRSEGAPVMAMERIPDRLEELPFLNSSPFQAKITITEGCSNFCSFCIVPYTTGLLRSRLPGAILAEAAELERRGYQEVQLLGQNVDSYGKDLKDPDVHFAGLLRAFTHVNIPRIRFTSSHPKDITEGVIQAMAEANNICEHLHMAVQSGSDRVLENMRRGYTKSRFLSLVRQIKDVVPNANITTDIIVGYPGESEADFEETVDLVKRARFGGAYIFKYSPRPGTISFLKYADDVPLVEKQRRLDKLLRIQKQITAEENESCVGTVQEVLVEGVARDQVRLLAKTRTNKTVVFHGQRSLIGRRVEVRMSGSDAGGLYGEVFP